jgi:hypothetical protein
VQGADTARLRAEESEAAAAASLAHARALETQALQTLGRVEAARKAAVEAEAARRAAVKAAERAAKV